jgi:RNA polymerase primary sigma factor
LGLEILLVKRNKSNCSLDISSSRLFYRELDALPMLSVEEESDLAAKMDTARMQMLGALLGVSFARECFLAPFRRLAEGGRITEDLLDSTFWSLEDGVIPTRIREGFRDLLKGLSSSPFDESSAREIRLNWQRVEEIGEAVFSTIDEIEKLEGELSGLEARTGKDASAIEAEAVLFETPVRGDFVSCWKIYPELVHIQRKLELLRIGTGNNLENFIDSGRMYREACAMLEKVMDTIVEANLRLVISVTRRFSVSSVIEEMDLVQEGCQGLLHAARRFDFQRGYRFSTYSVWWIRRYISSALTRDSTQTGIPPHLQKRRAAVQSEIENQMNSRCRYPTSSEIAEELDITVAQVDMIRAVEAGQLSVDQTYGGEDGVCLGDFLETDAENPESVAVREDLARRIEKALDSLPQRERSIISLRFGLFDGEPQSLESVSRIFGVSRERIRQIQSSTLARLRDMDLDWPSRQGDERG